MSAFKFFCVALSLVLAVPVFAKDASRTRLVTWPNPAKLGQTVKLVGEVDGFNGGAPTGTVNFTDGDVMLGAGTLSPYGAGQATLAASYHSCALTSGGGVACWGTNDAGQLGDGTTTIHYVPVAVAGLSRGVVAIAASPEHSCALTTVGGVKCWGHNNIGQLGDGTTTDRYVPVAVTGLASGVVAITAGSYHTCALTMGGGVKCWGWNANGQLGDGTGANRHTPVAVSGLSSGVVAIAAGGGHTCALTIAGGVKCWGSNWRGQLGDGTTASHFTPAAVSGFSSGVVAISASWNHNCLRTGAGAVRCWGANDFGELGDGTTKHRQKPVAVPGLSSGVVAVSIGRAHSCALKGGGALMCWGQNRYGQLGDRTKTDRTSPVSVPGHARGVVAIATGGDHTCVSIDSGVFRCWGLNDRGQLGDGTTRSRLAPKPIPGFTALVRARAPLLVNSLTAGTHTLRATYSGDAAHSQSSGSRAQTIVP